MNTLLRALLLSFTCLLCVATSACAEAPTSDKHEMDADSFRKHFADQNACVHYVEQIVHPAALELAGMPSIGEMRAWIDAHQKDKFARLAKAVQTATNNADVLDPRREKDQLAVTGKILPAMRELPGFDASHCGPNVRDILMDAVYEGVGGNNAPVVVELKRLGVTEISEQRWVLLVALLAHSLDEMVH